MPAVAQRAIALSLLAAALAGVWFAVGAPLLSTYRETEASLAEAQSLLDRYSAIAAQRPLLEAQLVELDRREAATKLYLDGPSESLAAVGLQRLATEAIARRGGSVTSAQPLPTQLDGAFRRVPLRIQFRSEVEGLAQVLADLERGRPLLRVDALEVRGRPPSPGRRPEGGPITVRIDVSGFMPAEARP